LKLARSIVAPQDSVVSRVRVVEGETVQQGQPLLSLQTGGAELEAWLYIATGSGGTVRPGHLIELRIDAFPHQIYGTQKAIVESVSAIALRPGELRVPLAIHEPVFEVRARLLSREIVSANNRWPLIAGLSFRADIVQEKHRLYRWMLRHVLPPESYSDG
jgi:membrane fusion protein